MIKGNGKRLVALAFAIVAASTLAKLGIHHGGFGTLNFAW
jgi:hypothetical protein